MGLKIACKLFALCVLCIVAQSECAKILIIIPTASYSHQIPYRKFTMELHKRGHEIVYVTPNPIPDYSAPNFTQIDVSGAYAVMKTLDFVKFKLTGITWLDFVKENMNAMVEMFSEAVFKNPEMQKLYGPNSTATFDVVIVEYLYGPSTFAFGHRFNAPLIGVTSLGLVSVNEFAMGGNVLPSHEYTWEMEAHTGPNLSFFKRLRNFVAMWKHMFFIYNTIYPEQQKLAEKYLGPLPPLIDITKNFSMIFIDESDVVTPSRPRLPNAITFTSTHIHENLQPLPKDLQKFLDKAKDGFIYFSLGSNAKSSTLPPELKRAFRDIFSKLPYRVVWKYEEEFPDKPKNVYTAPWLSQQTVLAHPNIKLFIYQGGLQSSEETIHFGVPIVGIPILADQDYQIARMVALGVGKHLDVRTMTAEDIENAIVEVITDKGYKERMIKLRERMTDTPYDLVQNLVWWTEYVIRTNGAPHLRSSLIHQPWYQRNDLDVIIFLTIISYVVLSKLAYIIVRLALRFHRSTQAFENMKQKTS